MNSAVAFCSVWSGSSLFAKAPKMSLDRSIGQNHLKVKGCQVCFIYCKFTKVPVLWQTMLTLNRRAVLPLSDLDLHCWDGVARSHKMKLRDPNYFHGAQWRESALWEKRSYYHVRLYCFVGIKFNYTDSANSLPIVTFIKVEHWDHEGLFITLSILTENISIIDTFISRVSALVKFYQVLKCT